VRIRAEGALLLAALAGCRVENVSLDTVPPTPPPPGSFGACTAVPSTLAHLPGILPLLGIDEFNVYTASVLVDSGGAQPEALWRVPKDGAPPVLLATSPTPITTLKIVRNVNDFFWYGLLWTTAGEPDADGGPGGGVWSLGVDAGDAPNLVEANRLAPVGVVAAAGQVYWAEQGVDNLGQSFEAIMGAPITGGPPVWIQSVSPMEAPVQLAVSIGGAQNVDGPPEFFPNSALYWTTTSPPSLAEIIASPLSAPFEPVARYGGFDAGGAGGINVTDWAVEVSTAGGIAIISPDADGGVGAPRTFFPIAGPVEVFADDGVNLYFVEPGTTNLEEAPYDAPDAGPPRTLLTGVGPTIPFRVDSTCVYLVDPATESVTMVAR
jgi:hypothetical protein